MGDSIIPIIIIAVIVGLAVTYIIRAKKSGQRCVGCPYAKSCSGGCSCDGGLDQEENK